MTESPNRKRARWALSIVGILTATLAATIAILNIIRNCLN